MANQMKRFMASENSSCCLAVRLGLGALLSVNGGWILHSGVTVLTSESNFLMELGSGYYLEDFNRFQTPYVNIPSPRSFVNETGTFSYSVSSTSGEDLYIISPQGLGRAVSVLDSKDNLLIEFPSLNVTAVGGQFFMTDYLGNLALGTVTVRLNDGTAVSISSGDIGTKCLFRGFISDGPIAWLLVQGSETHGAMLWPAFNHFYVGAVVPEPGSFALEICGLASMVLWLKLQRK